MIYKTVKIDAKYEAVYELKASAKFWKPDSWVFIRKQLIDRTNRTIRSDDYTWHDFCEISDQNGLKQGEMLAKLVEMWRNAREEAAGIADAQNHSEMKAAGMAAGYSRYYIDDTPVSAEVAEAKAESV